MGWRRCHWCASWTSHATHSILCSGSLFWLSSSWGSWYSTATPVRQVIPRLTHLIRVALGEKPVASTDDDPTIAYPQDGYDADSTAATQTVDLSASEHDRSYLYGDEEERRTSRGGIFGSLSGGSDSVVPNRPIRDWMNTLAMRHSPALWLILMKSFPQPLRMPPHRILRRRLRVG